MQERTRMAPSPTGEFHIGGMRTYLYNYAWAKKNDGQMLLRIEDTDKAREVEGSIERLLNIIKEYGMSWDEGPDIGGPVGPYIQSQRLDIYNKYVKELVSSGNAYYCFCTQERLEEMRLKQQNSGSPITRYDRTCRNLSEKDVQDNLEKNIPYVIRLKVPDNEVVEWDDIVLGNIKINTNELDDQVLLKSDGYPTYHLAVVIDDYLMKITTVLRGNEWIPSMPKQILLYKAFDWQMPKFGHLPNLKEANANKKMSKRFGDVHASKFLESGYLPEALLNFIMFLGWNPGTEKEIYSLEEFVNDFDIHKIHSSDLVAFDRDKLLWINGYYIRAESTSDLYDRIINWANKYNIDVTFLSHSRSLNLKILDLVKERLKTLAEFPDIVRFFYEPPIIDSNMLAKYAKDNTQTLLKDLLGCVESVSLENWNSQYAENTLYTFIKDKYSPKEAFMTLRIALSGKEVSPPIFDVLEVLGKEEVQKRIISALDSINYSKEKVELPH